MGRLDTEDGYPYGLLIHPREDAVFIFSHRAYDVRGSTSTREITYAKITFENSLVSSGAISFGWSGEKRVMDRAIYPSNFSGLSTVFALIAQDDARHVDLSDSSVSLSWNLCICQFDVRTNRWMVHRQDNVAIPNHTEALQKSWDRYWRSSAFCWKIPCW